MRKIMRSIAAGVLGALVCIGSLAATAMAETTATVKLPVSVSQTGAVPEEKEATKVVLTAVDGAPMPDAEETSVMEVEGGSEEAFPEITYTTPGVYLYTVSQEAGSNELASYDETVYYVKVTAAYAASGEFGITVAVYDNEAMDGKKLDRIEFVNEYEPEPTTEPETTEPETTEPETTEPETTEPETTEPETTEPETTEPETTEPETTEPETTTEEPTTAEKTTAEPTTAEPTTAEPTTAAPTTAAAEETTTAPAAPILGIEDMSAVLGGALVAAGIVIIGLAAFIIVKRKSFR